MELVKDEKKAKAEILGLDLELWADSSRTSEKLYIPSKQKVKSKGNTNIERCQELAPRPPSAMASTGFAEQKLYGSIRQLTPTKLDVEGSIQLHEPHPEVKIRFTVARRMGRRLMRAYGGAEGCLSWRNEGCWISISRLLCGLYSVLGKICHGKLDMMKSSCFLDLGDANPEVTFTEEDKRIHYWINYISVVIKFV